VGRSIALAGTNVVLVDNVDGPAGPLIVATRRTDPTVSEPLYPEIELLRRHADMYEFLQCTVPLPRYWDEAAAAKEGLLGAGCTLDGR
jgi:hypothetical protein